MEFFSCKYSTFLQQIATASLQKAFTNANPQDIQAFMLLAVGTCALVFNITRAMIGRNITYHSLEKKKKHSALIYLVAKQVSLPCFRFENG